MNEFALCPKCGSKKIAFVDGKKWLCNDCGLDLYCNVAAAVGLIIFDSEKNIIFEVRAKEPRKGFLALPGGFVNPDESAESAALRECREEIGVDIRADDIKYIASFPNTYEYKNFTYKTCDMFFACRIKSAAELLKRISADSKEVSGVCARRVQNAGQIESLPLAFNSAFLALKEWI